MNVQGVNILHNKVAIEKKTSPITNTFLLHKTYNIICNIQNAHHGLVFSSGVLETNCVLNATLHWRTLD